MLSCLLNNQIINLITTKYDSRTLEKWSDKNILLCPVCHKPYEYCHGRIRIPYFRHKDKAECEECYSEPETEEHLQGKIDLYNWLSKLNGITNLILEGWLPNTKQRPDLMFKYNNQLTVLEFQCSPISTEYLERHDLYEAANIKDIWFCGAEKYFQEYHKGNGIKKLNILENKSGFYYDTKTKLLHQTIPDLEFENYCYLSYEYFKHLHRMKTSNDFQKGVINYYSAKSNLVSYQTKYAKDYHGTKLIQFRQYVNNKSLTRCIPLGEVGKFVRDKCITT